MSEKFDEFSKHLATKRSRRGALKFLGAGLVGAFLSTVFSREADAEDWKEKLPVFNGTSPWEDYKDRIPTINELLAPYFNGGIPQLNVTLPDFNHTLPDFNHTLPPKFNSTLASASKKPTFFRRSGRR